MSRLTQTAAYKWARKNQDNEKQCLPVRQACRRFLADIERKDLTFDLKIYERIVSYPQMFRHFKGICAGQSFILRPDQEFFLGQLFAFKNKETGLRRFTDFHKTMPRKNGKTAECALLGGYCFSADKEAAPEVYSIASAEKQARECWTAFKRFALSTERYKKTLKFRTDYIEHEKSGGKFEPLPSDAATLEGRNPSCVIFDESHTYRNADHVDALIQGMGGRAQPISGDITTAGDNKTSYGYERFKYARAVLSGEVVADNFLPMIFTIDDGDDPFDIEAWHKANPALGISKTVIFMEGLAAKARMSTRALNTFLSRQLCVWTSPSTLWLPLDQWTALIKPQPVLDGKTCILSIDASATRDLTSINLLFMPQAGLDKFYTIPLFYVPATAAREKETLDRVPYETWQRDGHVYICNGGFVNRDFLFDEVLRLCKKYNVIEVAGDPWGLRETFAKLGALEIKTRNVRQGYQTISPAIKRAEELILSGDLNHNGNPCFEWNFQNVVLTTDPAGNVKLDKAKSRDRIDGVAAFIDSVAALIENGIETPKESEAPSCLII